MAEADQQHVGPLARRRSGVSDGRQTRHRRLLPETRPAVQRQTAAGRRQPGSGGDSRLPPDGQAAAGMARGSRAMTLTADPPATSLSAGIAALARDTDPATNRAEIVRLARAHLEQARQRAERALATGGSGLACARALSQAQDEVIGCMHDAARDLLLPGDGAGQRIAICATGGYGRGTLAPGSDIDILFLFPENRTAWHERFAEAVLYLLWDLRLTVGHATRTVEECIREAGRDYTIRTAILESRLVSGDTVLFGEMIRRFDAEVVSNTGAAYAQAKLEERDVRLGKAGASRYLVEPNVKEGKGGLRDLNTLFWIAKYVYRVQTADELVKAGLFRPAELSLFRRCEDFLWRVRCMMHFIAGRAEERLSFDMQRQVAARFRYRSRGGLSPVERFMKHYFMVTKDVGDLTAIVCAELEARHQKPRAILDRFFGPFRRRRTLAGVRDFIIDHGRLTAAEDDIFARDPVNLIRLFWLATRHDLELHPDVKRMVTLALRRIDQKLRRDTEANRLFMEVLTSANAPQTVLRRMHETGVLGRFVPEFGRIQAMMQFSSYHHYTVDEHTLRAIGVLSEIAAGRLKEEHPVANEIIQTIQNRRALSVALFLHDIGKGRDEDHSIVGERIARELCPRLGLSDAETETVSWLVRHHLLMSNVAQHRDVTDPKTIATFCATVQTLERLKLLLLLTVCDIKAVGPGVWNGWKGQLLRQLYWEAEVVLAGGHSAINRKQRVARAQADLRALLPKLDDAMFEAYAQRHYPAYWLKVDTGRKLKHAQLVFRADASEGLLLTETATDAFRGVTELTVLAMDHPRLLAILTGACAAAGANIVEAQIFTTTDGLALDTIFISRAFRDDADELRRAERVADHIVRALSGEIRLPEVIAARRKSAPREEAFSVAPDVVIDNALSDRSTVIEVTGLDRPGLLYELTTVLGKLNLNINTARITTFGEKAVDVFYVTDLTGGKLVTPQRQAALRKALLDVFG
jgi:[protein-PII] uridylyltransferase